MYWELARVNSEAVARKFSVKNVLLEILQNSQQTNRARVFFNKLDSNSLFFVKKESLA